ncbi:hypothetical protein PENTCL1PPCAC_8709 [Pristionchus entomophagus]|uniref:Uncharacterized protein n=1 Tax=Pristionchus entomophagus TaxID=358040 RepID=A0AAV5SYW0_9BILA|nr:hypothetical protein PENTCL1PPCAC_8709 [Pristionchus entomophagus]
MKVGMLVHSLILLLFLANGIDSNVYSCEELKYRVINSNMVFNYISVCVITEEGFTDASYNQLKHIYVDQDKQWSLYRIDDCLSSEHWKITADKGFTLNCDQDFTVFFTDRYPTIPMMNTPPHKGVQHTTLKTQYNYPFVVPQTGIRIQTTSCEGEGNVTVYSGTGSSANEESYLLRTYTCASVPQWIFSFDLSITMVADDSVTYSVEYTSNIDSTVTIAPGERIAIRSQ